MINNICVYRHVRLDNNETFYIGIGNFKRPYCKIRRSNWWKKIINKTDYRIDVLSNNMSWVDACELEIFLISLYGRKDLNKGTLINMTDGGEGTVGIKRSIEAYEKTRQSHIGKKRSEETKQKQRLLKLGKSRSKESILKQSQSIKGVSKPGRLILDFETGIFYESVIKASIAKVISYSTLIKKLQGVLINNTNLIYV